MSLVNRETWLEAAVEKLRPLFISEGITIPDKVRVSCAWAKRASANSVGWCWHREVSASGISEIQISPERADSVEVLGILTHELIHASDDGESKHSGYFRTSALALGLEGKMTATHPGDRLTETFTRFASELGPYPHSAINPKKQIGKQTTRMIKVQCPTCGYVVRTTQKWIEMGLPTCGVDETPMEIPL